MKKQFLIFSALFVLLCPSFGQGNFFDQLADDALILTQEGLVQGEENVNAFVKGFAKKNGETHSYKQKFSVAASSVLSYEVGEVKSSEVTHEVMFLRKKSGASNSDIEFLIIFEQMIGEDQANSIDQARADWMELCNAHQAAKLVSKMYAPEAYYYNRGRLLQGTAAITEEYGYMNGESYSLKLTPKHVSCVTPSLVYEIGQCSGSYNNPYVIVWQKQNDGNWQVLMDTND